MAIQIIGNSSTQIIADAVVLTGEPSTSDQVVTKSYVDERADKTYIHNQMGSSAIWNIAHNLNKKPSITVVDTAESVIIGEVDYIDNNNITLTFAFPFSGKAYLN